MSGLPHRARLPPQNLENGAHEMSGETLWLDCVRRLEALLPETELNTYIRPLHPVHAGEQLTLLAPNRVVCDRVRRAYVGPLQPKSLACCAQRGKNPMPFLR